jgi:hypothetical protein
VYLNIEEFEKTTSELVKDIQMLSMHWDLLLKLDAEIISSPSKFSKSEHFWSMTFNAHLTSVRIILSRVYDTHEKVLSIKTWLKIVKAELNSFKFMIEPSCCLRDLVIQNINNSDPKINRLVNILINQLRNNGIAHTNMKKARSGINVFKESELTQSDYQELITQAQEVINNYIPYILGYKVDYNSLHKDDYKKITSLL